MFETEPYDGPLLGLPHRRHPHLAGSTAEAQDRAGVVIAEQVAAALDGEVVRTAVNIPVVDPRELEVLGPFVPLAAKLGRLAVALAAGWPSRVTVAVHGPLSEHDTRLLTVAALNGISRADRRDRERRQRTCDRGRARDRGRRAGLAASRHYTNLVRVVVTAGEAEIDVAGTTVGPEHRLFLAAARGFDRHRACGAHGLLSYADLRA